MNQYFDHLRQDIWTLRTEQQLILSVSETIMFANVTLAQQLKGKLRAVLNSCNV